LTILNKDERIKRGGEEIIAIKKGQKLQYPQIRIFIIEDQVITMKFYDIYGKRYYEVDVKNYAKINGISYPTQIVEKLTSKQNEITNNINYSEVNINTAISDSEFK
jgi:hypothetical protein